MVSNANSIVSGHLYSKQLHSGFWTLSEILYLSRMMKKRKISPPKKILSNRFTITIPHVREWIEAEWEKTLVLLVLGENVGARKLMSTIGCGQLYAPWLNGRHRILVGVRRSFAAELFAVLIRIILSGPHLKSKERVLCLHFSTRLYMVASPTSPIDFLFRVDMFPTK